MNATLIKALILLVPTILALWYSLGIFKRKIPWATLQLGGAISLVIVVFTHVCEALGLFPWMHWGAEGSPGHYLDLLCAVLGLTLFPAGHILRRVAKHSAL